MLTKIECTERLLVKRILALDVIRCAAIGGSFALVCASSLDAFELACATAIVPLSFRSTLLGRPGCLKADVGFVAVRHIVHVVAMASGGGAVIIVHGSRDAILVLNPGDLHGLGPGAFCLADGERMVGVVRNVHLLLSIWFAALRRARDFGLGRGQREEH